jgi:hypothetical protein
MSTPSQSRRAPANASRGVSGSAPITPFREGRGRVESGVERGALVNAKVALSRLISQEMALLSAMSRNRRIGLRNRRSQVRILSGALSIPGKMALEWELAQGRRRRHRGVCRLAELGPRGDLMEARHCDRGDVSPPRPRAGAGVGGTMARGLLGAEPGRIARRPLPDRQESGCVGRACSIQLAAAAAPRR